MIPHKLERYTEAKQILIAMDINQINFALRVVMANYVCMYVCTFCDKPNLLVVIMVHFRRQGLHHIDSG